MDEEDVNYTAEQPPADDDSKNKNKIDNNVDMTDDEAEDDSNIDSNTTDEESNKHVAKPDEPNNVDELNEEDEVNRAQVPKEQHNALGNYWEKLSQRRVACVYWIANLDNFV